MRAGRLARLRVGVLLTALAIGLAGCSNDDDGDVATSATSDTTAVSGPDAAKSLDLVAEGKLTACTDVPSVPFEFEENGQLDGIDIELVRAVAGRLALAAEFKAVDLDGTLGQLAAGECDIVASSVVITDEGSRTVDFSDRYFLVNQSLLVRKGDESRFNELATLEGRTIGVQSGTTGLTFAQEKAKGATVRELTGAAELFTALEGRQIDAVLHDFPVNAHHAHTTGRTVVAKTFPESVKQYGFAMAKGQTALKKAIDDALVQVKSDDTYPTILRRFLGDTAGQI